MPKVLTESHKSHGVTYTAEAYTMDLIPEEITFTQVRAVCFTHEDNVVLYEDVDDMYRLLGGYANDGEKIEDTLERSLFEKAGVQLEGWEIIGIEKIWPENEPENQSIQLCVVARVTLLDGVQDDPGHKSIGRVICPYKQAQDMIGYELGKMWIKEAKKRLLEIPRKEYSGVMLDASNIGPRPSSK